MRVAHTVPNFRPKTTGPGQVAERLATEFSYHGIEGLIVTGPVHGQPERESQHAVDIERIPLGRAAALKRSLERFRPDVVIAHELRNPLTRVALKWAERNKVRSAVMPHGEANAYRYLPNPLQRAPYQTYDAFMGNGVTGHSTVIVTSATEEQDVRQLVGPKQDVVRLYLGSDMEPVPRKRSSGRARTLMLGNFGVFRDPRNVVEASKILTSRNVDHRLRLGGTLHGQSRFASAIPKKDLASAEYIGPVKAEDRARVYSEADVFCYPSRYESFGLPILEASLAGLPLVVSPVGIVPEVQTPNDEVVEGLKPVAIANALERILECLPEAEQAAAERAALLRPWARWKDRIEDYRAWLEDGSSGAKPPPTRTSSSPEPKRRPLRSLVFEVKS